MELNRHLSQLILELILSRSFTNKVMQLRFKLKANLKSKPGGGKGKLSLDWWVPEDSPADLFAFVDLERNRVWIIKKTEIEAIAQQHPEGRYHFFMVTDPTAPKRRDGKDVHDYEFQKYLLENRVHKVM